jgi:hypothetical protein
MRSDSDFYSRRHQFRKVLSIDWHFHGIDVLFGAVYALGGFYAFRRWGYSRIYDVTPPFVLISGVLAYLVWRLYALETKGATANYFSNLPRDRKIVWDARLVFLMLAALWLEALVFLGLWLRLGDLGIMHHYIIRPEMVVLPFYMTAFMLTCQCCPQNRIYKGLVATVVVSLVMCFGQLLACKTDSETLAQYIKLAIPLVVVACTLFLMKHARDEWSIREMGENL